MRAFHANNFGYLADATLMLLQLMFQISFLKTFPRLSQWDIEIIKIFRGFGVMLFTQCDLHFLQINRFSLAED